MVVSVDSVNGDPGSQRPQVRLRGWATAVHGPWALRLGLPLLVLGASFIALSAPAEPVWWRERRVLDPACRVTNDFAAVNAGQAKWFATNAYDELQTYLPGGAGATLTALVGGFSRSNNYVWLNQGQLKAMAAPFYDRLIAEGGTNAYPWTASAADDVNFAAANIGQLKHLFDFDIRWMSLTGDLDLDGLPDAWEQAIVDADPVDAITRPAEVLAGADFDGDGVSNGDEYRFGTSPIDAAIHPPLVRFVQATQTVVEAAAAQLVTIGLTLAPAATGPVEVTVSPFGGTATQGEDYTFTTQTVPVPAGSTGVTVTLAVPAATGHALEIVETAMLELAVTAGPALAGAPSRLVVEIVDAAADSDGDGLPDAWEAKYFISATIARPERDPDGDGWTNWQEYRRGGHPRMRWVPDSADQLELRLETVLE